jgi:tripartite-type tricarboxylate transporter receptor subunit TctC
MQLSPFSVRLDATQGRVNSSVPDHEVLNDMRPVWFADIFARLANRARHAREYEREKRLGHALYDKLNFDFVRDIVPAASIVRTPLVMAVNPSVPAKSVFDFVAYTKASPGKVNMASGGNGTTAHLAGEMFNMMADIKMVHVPYRGSAPALTDLVGGQVQVIFDPLPSSIEFIRAGKPRALAVTTATRLEVLPDVPSVGEFLPGFEASAWQGVGAPKKTPAEIVDRLNKEINAALADPKIKARLADLGSSVFSSSPAEFGKFIAAETEKWGKVVKFSGAKPD